MLRIRWQTVDREDRSDGLQRAPGRFSALAGGNVDPSPATPLVGVEEPFGRRLVVDGLALFEGGGLSLDLNGLARFQRDRPWADTTARRQFATVAADSHYAATFPLITFDT